MVPLIAAEASLDMVLDTGSPLSTISLDTRDRLLPLGCLEQVAPRRYTLAGISLGGQALPALTVHLSRTVTRVGAQGTLGLNFLQQFREVCFDVPSMRLILRS